MYPGRGAAKCPDKPAFIMAETGEAVSYAELEARSNRLAHLLRARGLATRNSRVVLKATAIFSISLSQSLASRLKRCHLLLSNSSGVVLSFDRQRNGHQLRGSEGK
jgi:hypothetical protein